MKKLSLILGVLLVSASVALSGCGEKTPSNEKTPVEIDEELIAYNEKLESTLDKLVPKSDLDKEVLGYINGLPNSAAQVKYVAVSAKNMALSEEEIQAEIDNYYRQNAALITLAYQKGIPFGDEKDEELISSSIASMKSQFGDEYDSIFEDSPYTQYYYYLFQTVYSPMFSKLIDHYLENKDPLVYDKVVKFVEENEYVRAKHILISFPEAEDGELSDVQKQETLKKANAVLEEVNAMSDISEFDALIEKYNEDPGMDSYPNGYYFTKGEMVLEFEETAYSIEEGKTSGLVETPYGYHILLRLPVFDELFTESPVYIDATVTALNEYLIELGKDFEIVYTDNYQERYEQFQSEYEEMLAKAEAEAQEQTESEKTAE